MEKSKIKMTTEILEIDSGNPDKIIMEKAGAVIRAGGLVAFPTETVYGLGGDALNPDSSKKIYAAKGRPSDNPLIVHIADRKALDLIAENITEAAEKIMDAFWPGPITLIFKKKPVVPYETTGGLDTVAVRCPLDAGAREFIRAAGGYVAAPSANISGRPSPTSGQYVIQDMKGKIDMILVGSDSQIGLESTILDMTCNIPVILRPGIIDREMLAEVIGSVRTDPALSGEGPEDLRPRAPGMKYRHYAPKGEMTIVSGKKEAVVEYINARLGEYSGRAGVMCCSDTADKYNCKTVHVLGERNSYGEISHNLYKSLRQFDDEEISMIYSEDFGADSTDSALMNRLKKAAGGRIIKL